MIDAIARQMREAAEKMAAAATSLNGVLEPWTWLPPVLGTLVPVLLAMALTRTLRLNGALTALVGVLALIGALTAQFVPRQSILGVVPGPGTSLHLYTLLTDYLAAHLPAGGKGAGE